MVVFGQRNKPIIIDDLYTPIVEDHIWVLDLEINDFTLTPLAMLQEIICSSISLQVNGVDMILPANWFMLIYDEETTMLDVVQISELSGRPFRAFTYGFKDIIASSSSIKTIDYHPQYVNVVPSLNKKQMLLKKCIGEKEEMVQYLVNKLEINLIHSLKNKLPYL